MIDRNKQIIGGNNKLPYYINEDYVVVDTPGHRHRYLVHLPTGHGTTLNCEVHAGCPFHNLVVTVHRFYNVYSRAVGGYYNTRVQAFDERSAANGAYRYTICEALVDGKVVSAEVLI